MHPEIKKFWEDNGYKVEETLTIGYEEDDIFWNAQRGSKTILVAQTHRKNKFRSIYFLPGYGNAHEKEMLKLIKLKAFL